MAQKPFEDQALVSANFLTERNSSTRIDVFEELSPTARAALYQFFRRLGAPHYVDEVLLPTLELGDAQIFCAVRDRPWPPWGLGGRTISAVCESHAVAPESWAVSPVYVSDEDATNVGLIAAVYKEVLQTLAVSKSAEVSYLAVEGSVLGDAVLRGSGFRRDDDVVLTEHARYYTYRAPARELLERLHLEEVSTPDLLASDFPRELLLRNALFHQSLLLGARGDLIEKLTPIPEILRLDRGGHASKPGGVPGGSGSGVGTDIGAGFPGSDLILPYVALGSFLGDARDDLTSEVLEHQRGFQPATVLHEGQAAPVVDKDMRRGMTLDDLGFIKSSFLDRLKGVLEPAMSRLGMEPFPVGQIEIQVTASGDGDYYRMHRDADGTSTRVLSFVYFFHLEPRGFSGGELRIFDDRRVRGHAHADSSHLVSPRQDSLVLFPSHSPHELLPVRVPSKKFSDRRFTVNGWIHRAPKC